MRRKGKPHNSRSGDDEFSVAAVRGQAHHTPAPSHTAGHVQSVVGTESETLGPAQSTIEATDVARGGDAKNLVEARRGRAGHVEVTVGPESEMISCQARFQGRENKNLAVGMDLKNGSAAVAHVEVPTTVKGNAGGNAH